MTKLFPFLLLFMSISWALSAQDKTTKQSPSLTPSESTQKTLINESRLSLEQKMKTIQNCPELFNQLTAKFGKDFSLNDKKVIDLLKRNATDNNIHPVIKKVSIYLINN